ncbi:MAG: FkbM family methyltransferase [Ginsengibacter sp.]
MKIFGHKSRKYFRKSNDPNFDYYETPTGNYYLPKNCEKDSVAKAMKAGELFDKHIIDAARSYVKPGSIILDIGSNYGQMAVEFSRMYPSTNVYAFEAQEMVYHILEKNLKANNALNVKPFYNAVYDKNDIDLIFPVPDLVRFPAYGSYGIDLKAKAGKVVKSITIDSLDFKMPVSFMKVDIQGSDLAAMKGATNTIKKHQMPIIFEYEEQFQAEFETSFQDYVDFVHDIGYKFVKTVEAINYLIVPV